MEFEDKLQRAIQRGQDRTSARANAQKRVESSKEDIRNRHNEFRLNLSDHIEACLKKLAQHFPGFDYETIYGAKGWGGAVSRNDIDRGPDGRAGSFFSRIELTVRPQNEFNIVNIAGKGTIRDKEIFTWNHFEDILEAGQDEFQAKIDKWVLEFAEQFATR
tara:strand:+ start:888 stop:1370 length:483 start_codon:yes stop_codon:yes gene_type:complete